MKACLQKETSSKDGLGIYSVSQNDSVDFELADA